MKLVKYWGPTVALMALIFFLSSRTRVKVSDVYAIQFMIFKSLHVIEYALLYTLMYRSLRNTTGEEEWKNRFNAALYTLLYAISDEVHQVLVPTREGRMRDVFIDSIGITLAAVTIWKLLPKAPKLLKNWAKKLELL